MRYLYNKSLFNDRFNFIFPYSSLKLSLCFDMFRHQTAVKTRCSSMHFIVAETNTKSIEFYKRRGAADLSSEEGWRLFKIGEEELVKMTKAK